VCEDIIRQRIGSDYRLLFRLLPDRVQVVTLINRATSIARSNHSSERTTSLLLSHITVERST
jgi:hypothetical protein